MKTIDAKQCTAIALGRLGENDYTVVRFDVSAWITEIPGAVIGLYNQRPGAADAYPIAAIVVEDGIATWTVTSAELTKTGEGRCELVAIAGEVVAKSAIFRTMVFDALDGSGEVPEPWEEWQQQLIILKGEAEQAADRAEEAVEHYPRIVDGVWEVWDAQAGVYVSTGVQAQGPQGIQGVPGPQGEPGAQGETGPQGEPGADGVTFTPAVSAEGVISWTNDGGKTNPQPVNIKGPKGDTGATGPQGEPGADYVLTDADKAEIAQQAEELLAPVLDTKAPAIWEDASGSIAHFADGAGDMPLRECVIQIEPVQEGTGDPSPENVRLITGWTGAKAQRTGRNLLPTSSYIDRTRSQLNNSFIPELNAIMAGESSIFVISGKTEAVQSDVNIIQLVVKYSDETQSRFLIYRGADNPSGVFAGEWEYSTDIGKGISAIELGGNTSSARCTLKNLQLELGSTATDYEPYQSSTYDITFPTEAGTVYGGTLDVVRGVLTVTHGIIASYAGETLPGEWISDRDVYAAGTTPTTGAQVVYALAEPITYTLTPQEIRTLLGTNNIWADTGDTAVTYQADTKMFVEQNAPESPVQDVQVNGVSVLSNGVANVPKASTSVFGATCIMPSGGINLNSESKIYIGPASEAQIESGTGTYWPITPPRQHLSVFYGLAKAAGADEKNSTLPVGQYTESAKSTISTMLNGPVTVSGATPSITALAGIQYICGEVSTLDITLPASGCIDVVFQSGATPTVLTVTPPSGQTVKWANGFDPTALEANTTYEINIKDGLGVAASWT